MRIRTYVLLLLAVVVGGQDAVDESSTTFDIPPLQASVNNEQSPEQASAPEVPGVCKALLSTENLSSGLVNGTDLALLLALPLTYKGAPVLSPGFFQLASALMAIDHFNEHNSMVVPELESIKDCPVKIDYDRLLVMDTGTIENNALNTIYQSIRDQEVPNAIIGPYNEIPAVELSAVASALGIPMVSHRAIDHDLLLPNKHPMVTMLNADLYAEMDFLGAYLKLKGRTDYIAVLYASSGDSTIQRWEAFRGVANELGMENVQAFGYVSPTAHIKSRPVQNIEQAVKKLADSGYRTIVWMTPDVDRDLTPIGIAAHHHGLDTGDHLWVMAASLEIDRPMAENVIFHHMSPKMLLSSLRNMSSTEEDPFEGFQQLMDTMAARGQPDGDDAANVSSNFNEMQFLFNSAFLREAELKDPRSWENSAFMKAWFQLNSTFIERMEKFNPITIAEYQSEWERGVLFSIAMGWLEIEDMPSLDFPPHDLFSDPKVFFTAPNTGAIYLYDAIMSVGLGACSAVTNVTTRRNGVDQDNKMTGEMLQTGIRSAHFHGSSGEIRFGDGFPGSRNGDSVTYGVFNLFPSRSFQRPLKFTEYRNATDGTWVSVEPFVYADGSTSPPELLRDPADPNYLSDGVRIVGLTLAGVAFFVILVSLAWVIAYRRHAVVVASQPIFLVGMCCGSAIETVAIVLLSFDEGSGWTVDALSAVCLAIPWLVATGHILIYNMLFTKLWRVNRVLQFSRRKVDIKHVLWPALLVEAAAFIVLSIWTATTDYSYVRYEIDESTGETMAKCYNPADEIGFWIPIVVLGMIPTLLTGVMAWKTIDVDATYSESKWVFALILVQCQVILVGLPLVVILEDVSTDGRYLGTALVLWTFPMSTMGLIILPKMVSVHFPPKQHRDTRGSSAGVRVTGMSSGARVNTTVASEDRHPLDRSSPEKPGISHQAVIQR